MLKAITSFLHRALVGVESIPVTAQHIIVAVIFVGVVRSLLELFGSNTTLPVTWHVSIVLHQIAFYACAYFVFLVLLRIIIPKALTQERQLKSVVLFGIFAGLLPPVIDLILPASFFGYTYFSQFTWTLFALEQPIGESVTLWLVVFSIGLYVWYKTGSFIHSLCAVIGAYGVVQFLLFGIGAMSIGLFTILAPVLGVPVDSSESSGVAYAGAKLLALQGSAVMVLLGCLTAIFAVHRRRVFHMALLRLPHALVWGALVLLGAALADGGIDVYIVLKAVLLTLFFVFAQIENDYFDRALDALTDRKSPVIRDDLHIIRFITCVTVVLFLIFDPAFGLVLGLFVVLFNFAYSHTSFYLKRHFVSGSIIEGMVAFIALLAGIFHFSTVQAGATVWYAALTAIAFGIFANVRDYKDFDGDRQGGITTLYTLLAEKGVDPMRTHMFLWVPTAIVSILSALYVIFGMVTTPGMYGTALVLVVTALLPMFYIKKRRLSTTLAVTHTVILLLAVSVYIVPAVL